MYNLYSRIGCGPRPVKQDLRALQKPVQGQHGEKHDCPHRVNDLIVQEIRVARHHHARAAGRAGKLTP